MRVFPWTILALLVGCAGNGISEEVLEVVRATRLGGEFHLEFDADGDLIEAGSTVELESVPQACRAAVDAAHPGGRQAGAERVFLDGHEGWMVAKEIDGRGLEILVRDDGKILGGEETLSPTAWPEAVVAAAKAALPGAALERVERVWGTEARGKEAYHVKFRDHGESLRVGLASDGKVLRVVRRLQGQVRVPR